MLKRLLDLVLSGCGLIILLPLFAVIALQIKRDSPGPVFYLAPRIGQHGKPYKLYKFRSMVVDADRQGQMITTAADRRITPVGQFIRRTKIDELPQLLNVFRGEMSLVGPRPESPRYVEMYTSEQREILGYRPGITSPASLTYHNEAELLTGADWEQVYIEQIMPDKLRIDLEYMRQATVWSDLAIVFATIRKAL
jgi:lipopolysaccharide/colanic/teichoic acid biosynthesis glycosyltransferase